MMPKFLRRAWNKYSKLGKKRKKKQTWRRPTGRDNKMREQRKGRPAVVSVGYKKQKSERKTILIVKNVAEMEKIKKNEIVSLGKVGKKRREEILKKAKEMGIKIFNLKIVKAPEDKKSAEDKK